jgi:hypothetical protein
MHAFDNKRCCGRNGGTGANRPAESEPPGNASRTTASAATVFLVLGVSGRAVMGIMGWSNSALAVRYQHMTDQVRRDIAATRRTGLG